MFAVLYLKQFACFAILGLTAVVQAIKIKEEYSGKTQRFVSMDEIEEKSKYYLRYHKHIGDDEIIDEKVKIMGDRIQELYREHGLDAIHDIFEHVDDLELAIGREDRWQAYMAGLVYPKPLQESRYARHILAGIVAAFIVAVVMATPFSYKYAKRFLKGATCDKSDAELVGADSYAEVLIRRMKKRTRKIFYRPMVPSFSMSTESNKSAAELEEAKEKLRLRIIKEAEFKEKKKKEKEERLREARLAIERRKRILLDDDASSGDDDDQRSVDSTQCEDKTPRTKKRFLIVPKNLRRFWKRSLKVKRKKKL